MKTWTIARRAFIAAALATGIAGPAVAGGHQVVDSIHFLIPGGAGGGWGGGGGCGYACSASRNPGTGGEGGWAVCVLSGSITITGGNDTTHVKGWVD